MDRQTHSIVGRPWPPRGRLPAFSGAAIMTIGGLLGGSPVSAPRQYDEPTFLGYLCGGDCTLHKAGFAWAVNRRVVDATSCVHAEVRFVEGCRAHVEEGLAPVEAGRRWAEQNDIVDARQCAGAGAEFRRGCEAQLTTPAAGRSAC